MALANTVLRSPLRCFRHHRLRPPTTAAPPKGRGRNVYHRRLPHTSNHRSRRGSRRLGRCGRRHRHDHAALWSLSLMLLPFLRRPAMPAPTPPPTSSSTASAASTPRSRCRVAHPPSSPSSPIEEHRRPHPRRGRRGPPSARCRRAPPRRRGRRRPWRARAMMPPTQKSLPAPVPPLYPPARSASPAQAVVVATAAAAAAAGRTEGWATRQPRPEASPG